MRHQGTELVAFTLGMDFCGMVCDAVVPEQSCRLHARVIRNVRLDERNPEPVRHARHLRILCGIRPEYAADDRLRAMPLFEERAYYFSERDTVRFSVIIAIKIRNVFTKCDNQIFGIEIYELFHAGRNIPRAVAPASRTVFISLTALRRQEGKNSHS